MAAAAIARGPVDEFFCHAIACFKVQPPATGKGQRVLHNAPGRVESRVGIAIGLVDFLRAHGRVMGDDVVRVVPVEVPIADHPFFDRFDMILGPRQRSHDEKGSQVHANLDEVPRGLATGLGRIIGKADHVPTVHSDTRTVPVVHHPAIFF